MSKTWYAYDPEEGFEFFDTEDEARKWAEEAMEHYHDTASDGWPDNIAALQWGEVLPRQVATCVASSPAPAGSEFDEMQEWVLEDVKRARKEVGE